jgi:hypothetical protein
MKPGIGSLIFADTFTDASIWNTVDSDQASAIIQGRQLVLAVEPGATITTLRRDVTLSNFYAEFNARIGLCRGNDTYGFLIQAAGSSFYRFLITCNGFIHVERIKDSIRLVILEPVISGDVPLGPPGEVQIGIWAVNGEMRLFLNDRYQFTLIERTFRSGAFGLFVQSKSDTPLTMVFSDLNVYEVNYIPPTNTPSP